MKRALSEVAAWLIVFLLAVLIYLIIRLGQSALGLESIFHERLAVGDERRLWVLALVLFPFVIGLALLLFSTVMGKSVKLVALFGTAISYAALAGQFILSMSGSWLLILPLVLPLQPLEKWLGLSRAGYLPIRGEPLQDILVPALIALGISITAVGLTQVIAGAKRKRLVTYGLYATMRHPQHLGIILWALGFALWGCYYLDFLFWFTLVYVMILIAWHEEGNLKKSFGIIYFAYQRNIPFIVPFLPKKGTLPPLDSGKTLITIVSVYIIGIAVIFGAFYFFSVPFTGI